MKAIIIKRKFLHTAQNGLLGLATLGLAARCAQKSVQQKPNIIFFIADDMRPEICSFHPRSSGSFLTPTIDKLAAEGTALLGGMFLHPCAPPGRFNCLTGRYASRSVYEAFFKCTEREEEHTVIQWNTMITLQDATLPHYLQKAGYATGMVGKNHVIAAHGFI